MSGFLSGGGRVFYTVRGPARAQVVRDPKLGKSGTYWSWSNDSESFENTVSEEVSDGEKGRKLWDLSERLVGLK